MHYFFKGANYTELSLILLSFLCSRSPALIGCFVVDRKYFEEIGLLDEGMEIYGGENVELGIRVRWSGNSRVSCGQALTPVCAVGVE